MKKMFVVLTAVLAMAFVSCSNSSDSGGGDKTVFSGTTWKCIDHGGSEDMLYIFAASGYKVTRKNGLLQETVTYAFEEPGTAKIAAGTVGGAEDFIIDENDSTKATGGNGLTHFVKQL